jgi:hypothetical protein
MGISGRRRGPGPSVFPLSFFFLLIFAAGSDTAGFN